MRNWLLFGGLLLLAFRAKGKVNTLVKLEFGTTAIKINRTKTGLKNGLVLEYGLSVYNPTQLPLTFRGFTGNIFDKNNVRVGNIDSSLVQPNIKIVPRGTTTLPLLVIIPSTVLAGQLATILKSLLGGGSVKLQGIYHIRGLMNIAGLPQITVDESFDLSDYNL